MCELGAVRLTTDPCTSGEKEYCDMFSSLWIVHFNSGSLKHVLLSSDKIYI